MADQSEQMNRLLQTGMNPNMPSMGSGPTSDTEMQMMSPPKMRPEGMGATSDVEINMINSAQQGLMAIDPQGAEDVVTGLEITKGKVKEGGKLTPAEFSGIKAILDKLSGALSGMMGGRGESGKQYMVDGNPVMMTDQEMMAAKNAGILVQDMGTYQVDDRMEQMTPDTYAARVASGEITPDQLMMESSGSTRTPAEASIDANAEFNRRVQEEQERMFRMNNTPQMSPNGPR